MSPQERSGAIDPSHRYAGDVPAGYSALLAEGVALVDAGVHFGDLTQIFSEVVLVHSE